MAAGIPTGRTMHPHHLEPQPACRSGLDDALAGLGAGVLVVDGGGQVTFANPQAAAAPSSSDRTAGDRRKVTRATWPGTACLTRGCGVRVVRG